MDDEQKREMAIKACDQAAEMLRSGRARVSKLMSWDQPISNAPDDSRPSRIEYRLAIEYVEELSHEQEKPTDECGLQAHESQTEPKEKGYGNQDDRKDRATDC